MKFRIKSGTDELIPAISKDPLSFKSEILNFVPSRAITINNEIYPKLYWNYQNELYILKLNIKIEKGLIAYVTWSNF